MFEQIFMSLARHAATFLGGTLATYGIIDASQTQMVAGALVTLAGVAWSAWDKKQRFPKK